MHQGFQSEAAIMAEDDTLAVLDSTVDGVSGEDR